MNRSVLLSGAMSVVVAAVPAFADDLTISTNTATGVATATAANGTPGNITITSTGAVAITTTGAAVTLNSNNSVSNSGTISNSSDTSAVGVQISGGNTGSFTNAGVINLPGSVTPSAATGQFGVLLQSGSGIFTGNIVTAAGSTVTVSGFSANGIGIESELNGNLTLGGTVTAQGSGSNGVIVSGLIDGAVTNTGTITTARQATSTANPGSAVAIGGSVAGGFLNAGPVSTADTTASAVIGTVGTAPALIVAPSIGLDVSNITLAVFSDVNAPGNSIINRGKITATGDLPALSTTAIQIGNASDNTSGKTTVLSGGFYNSGIISAVATSDAPNAVVQTSNATAIVIGTGATVPLLTNTATGNISAMTSGSVAGNTVALSILSGGSLTTLNNAGIIASSADATATAVTALSAYGIQDASGELTQITNSGTISATATVLDAGGQKTIAADLSVATSAITFTNTGTVTGDILFGSAAGNQLTIEGAHALVAGNIEAFGTGKVNIAVSGGGAGGTLQTSHVVGAGTLTLGPQGTVNLGVGTNDPVISATGPVSFAASSHILLTPISLLPTGTTIDLIHSDTSLTFGNFAATTANVQIPFLFTGSLSTDAKNLFLSLQRKTASDLGLTGNAAAIFEPALDAALKDSPIGAAFSTLGSSAEVQSAVEQLLPITSNASLAAIETITDSSTDAVGARQRTLRVAPGPAAGFSIWAQGLYGMFHGSGDDGYTGHGTGGAVGVDFSQPNKGHFGLALTIYDAKLREKSPLIADTDTKSYLISPYMGFRVQNFFVDAQLNAGEASVETSRTVNVGSVTRVTTGKADEMVASGGISGGYIWDLGFVHLIPQANVNGIELFDHNYTETGGGPGVDLTINSHHQSSLRSFVGLGADASYQAFGARLVPQVLAGWSQELISGSPTVTAAFASNPDSTFQVSGPSAGRSGVIAGAGFDFVAGDWSLELNYSARINSTAVSQTAGLTMSARF